jgi:hypothetical protein
MARLGQLPVLLFVFAFSPSRCFALLDSLKGRAFQAWAQPLNGELR